MGAQSKDPAEGVQQVQLSRSEMLSQPCDAQMDSNGILRLRFARLSTSAPLRMTDLQSVLSSSRLTERQAAPLLNRFQVSVIHKHLANLLQARLHVLRFTHHDHRDVLHVQIFPS